MSELEDGDPPAMPRPTSHERRSGRSWDATYLAGSPPWDIGAPQPAILGLVAKRAFTGTVLDAGCGTGENGLCVASLGMKVVGVDLSETAVSVARQKAEARGIDAEFLVADALRLKQLGREFDSGLDCGLFHSLDAEERHHYVTSLASVTRPGAAMYVLCFSDVGPGSCGPHPVSENELREACSRDRGWNVAIVSPSEIQTTLEPSVFPAWLAKLERV